MTWLFSATTKKIQRQMTMRNKNIINFLKRHKDSTLADIASEIQLPFSTTLVELKYLNKLGFVIIKDNEEPTVKPIKKRKAKKKKLKLKDNHISDLDKWIK